MNCRTRLATASGRRLTTTANRARYPYAQATEDEREKKLDTLVKTILRRRLLRKADTPGTDIALDRHMPRATLTRTILGRSLAVREEV